MPKIRVKLELSAKSKTQLVQGIKRDGSKAMASRVLTAASVISKEIGAMLVGVFNNTEVARSLRGTGSEDLQSHFGLDDNTANTMVDGMAELIRSSVKISTKTTGGSEVAIRVQAIEDSWGDYLSLPGAEYISQPSDITIPVMRWLLVDPTIDIGQAAYDIVFQGDDNNLDVTIQKVSRSGRAIMVSLEKLGGGGGYVLPSIISGKAGKNFIEYTLGQQEVAIKAAEILVKRIR